VTWLALLFAGLATATDAAAARARGHELRNRLGLGEIPSLPGLGPRIRYALERWPKSRRVLMDVLSHVLQDLGGSDPKLEPLIPWLAREINAGITLEDFDWRRLRRQVAEMEAQDLDFADQAGRQAFIEERAVILVDDEYDDPYPAWRGRYSKEPLGEVTLVPGIRNVVDPSGTFRLILNGNPEAVHDWMETVNEVTVLEGGRRYVFDRSSLASSGLEKDVAPVHPSWSNAVVAARKAMEGMPFPGRLITLLDAVDLDARIESTVAFQVQRAFQEIADWMDQVRPRPDISRLSFREAAAGAGTWHDALVKIGFDSLVPIEPEDRVRMRWSDGAVLVELHSKRSLANEGLSMGHCVGGYWPHVRDGATTIWSYRAPDGRPRATVETQVAETDNRVVMQAVGPRNHMVPSAEFTRVRVIEALLRRAEQDGARLSAIAGARLSLPFFMDVDRRTTSLAQERVAVLTEALRATAIAWSDRRREEAQWLSELEAMDEKMAEVMEFLANLYPEGSTEHTTFSTFYLVASPREERLDHVRRGSPVPCPGHVIAIQGVMSMETGMIVEVTVRAGALETGYFPGTEPGYLSIGVFQPWPQGTRGQGGPMAVLRWSPGEPADLVDAFYRLADAWPDLGAWVEAHRAEGAGGEIVG